MPDMFIQKEAYTRGGTLTDPLREWCRIGLTYMRTSSLSVPSHSASSTPTISISTATLLSSVPPSILAEVDNLAKWTRWTKMRWHIEMRRNVLLQQGAGVAAGKVDVDECVRFVAGLMGEEVGASGSVDGGKGGKKLLLNDSFAWAWFVPPSVLATIDLSSSSTSSTEYHRAGPRRPDVAALRTHLLAPFLEQLGSVIRVADEMTLGAVKRGPQGR